MALTTSDYLIKIGDKKLPNKFIQKDSYSARLDRVLAGSYTNANGDTYEEYLPHKKLNAGFSVSPLTEAMYNEFISCFSFIGNTQDVNATCWIPRENRYVTQRVKVEGIDPVLIAKSIRYSGIYEGMKITLTGRGGAT